MKATGFLMKLRCLPAKSFLAVLNARTAFNSKWCATPRIYKPSLASTSSSTNCRCLKKMTLLKPWPTNSANLTLQAALERLLLASERDEFFRAMDLQPIEYRRVASHTHPTLIESWCPLCGLFVAAAQDLIKLKAAEDIHRCQERSEFSS